VKAAERRIAQLRFFDEAILIEAGETPRVLGGWSRNKRALARALHSAKLSTHAGDIRRSLALAHHLAEPRENAEIVLFSGGVWEETPPPEALAGVQTRWIGKEAVNTGLSLFTARRSPATPGDYQLVAQVVGTHGTGAMSPPATELELRRNGVLIDVQPVQLEPGKPWQKTWEGSSTEEVRFEARLRGMGEAPRDDLGADNQAEARLRALRPVPVEIVGPAHPFLTAALESLPLVRLHQTPPAGPLPPQPDPDSFYIFYRSLPPPGFKAKAMLVIAPEAEGFWGKPNGFLDSALVSESLKEEPILRFVSLENLRLQKAHDLSPSPGAKVFAQSFGKPLLFGHWETAGNDPRWLVLAFGLDDSDLVFRTAFPILIGNLIQSLQPEEQELAANLPGAATSQFTPLKAAASGPPPGAPAQPPLSWWTALPFWWWALLLATAWLLAEWWLYSRRITE